MPIIAITIKIKFCPWVFSLNGLLQLQSFPLPLDPFSLRKMFLPISYTYFMPGNDDSFFSLFFTGAAFYNSKKGCNMQVGASSTEPWP